MPVIDLMQVSEAHTLHFCAGTLILNSNLPPTGQAPLQLESWLQRKGVHIGVDVHGSIGTHSEKKVIM